MTQHNDNQDINTLKKSVFDLVTASRQQLQGGMVDLSPIEHSIRAYCEAVSSLPRDEGKTHSADLALMTQEMDALEQDLRKAYETVQKKLMELGQHHKAQAAYRKSTGSGSYKPANDE